MLSIPIKKRVVNDVILWAKILPDVWEFPKVTTGEKRSSKERTGHPAQFPLGIIERIVQVSSNQLEIVLDIVISDKSDTL
jgi:DNA modification methylase